MKQYRIWAMSRSGHHAIAAWIEQQLKQNGKVFFVDGILSKKVKKKLKTVDRIKIPEGTKYYIHNIEDKFIKDINCSIDEKGLSEIKYKLHLQHSNRIQHIIILRDPFNMFASRIKSGEMFHRMKDDAISDRAVNLWIEHAKEYLRITKQLCSPICISYNEWFLNPEYRRLLARLFFADQPDDSTLNKIGRIQSRGSSFDGLKYQDKANEMNVMKRYEQYLVDHKYMKNMLSEEILYLSNRIFPNITKYVTMLMHYSFNIETKASTLWIT